MPLRLVTAPAAEPVTLTEAKAHLRIESDNTDDDTYVTTLITAAREHLEAIAWRGFISQSWELALDEFPGSGEVELPKGQLVSVTSVQYVDGEGETQTLASSEYDLDTKSVPGKLLLGYGKSWPTTREQRNAVTITYVVGWADAASVPTALKQAVLLLISQMYEHRVPEIAGTIVSPVKFAVDALLAPYRLTRF